MNYIAPRDLLRNRTLLVTGASAGIGRQAALSYAQHGADVVLLARNQTKLTAVVQQIRQETGRNVWGFVIDFTQATADDCQQLAQHIALVTPKLDGLLHNAGALTAIKPLLATSAAEWQQVLRVNLDTTFFLTQSLLPLLLKSDAGSLIFTSSSVGRQGRAGWGPYAVSKFATEGLMQVLAQELADTAVRVNCINPGGTRTEMRAKAFPDENRSKLKTPADIMPLYLWLMGADSIGETGNSFDAQPGRKPGAA